ncbi:hypothetical protein CN198_13810 [Sinorhizobium meliloti]|uniref:hypothetical protein n=1 Tax=Rhizobium meliloti TaxID=382 RepID=UPI000FD95325|nr:hypothetical protein [Sinorhizobium meliloti]RVH69139.1 hypothetical protein CN198_13810 [Sinorhizobium meliloti]
MTYYFNGMDRTDARAESLIPMMDTAEERLIGCFVPPSRRNGAIAFRTIPVLPEEGQGHAVVVTIRRFPDGPEDTISGEHWKLISTNPKVGFFDPDSERVVIGLPIADLKALRLGGLDCEGIFVPYEEVIRHDEQGQPYHANGIDLELLEQIGVNDFLDSWEPETPEAKAECERIAWERTLWIDWNAGPEEAPIQHPPIGGKWGYNAPV